MTCFLFNRPTFLRILQVRPGPQTLPKENLCGLLSQEDKILKDTMSINTKPSTQSVDELQAYM